MSSVNSPARVLFLGKNAGRGGMPRELSYLIKFLDKQRFEPMVILPQGGDLIEIYRKYATTHIYEEEAGRYDRRFARWGTFRKFIPSAYQESTHKRRAFEWLHQLIRDFSPDLLVSQYHQPIWLFDSIKEFDIPIIQTVLLVGAQMLGIPQARQEQMILEVDGIICPGIGVRRHLISCMGVDPGRIVTICTGLDFSMRDQQMADQNRPDRRKLGLDPDDIVVATAGAMRFLKGADVWVEAAAKVLQYYPRHKIKFLWIGGSSRAPLFERSVKELALRLGIEKNILFVGDQEFVYPYLDLCDIYVQPSRDDAFPHATMEAMALAKPVVASPQGIALEEHAQQALIPVETLSSERLAEGIIRLIDNPLQRQKLGSAGLDLINCEYNIHHTIRLYEEFLLHVLNTSRSSASA